MIRDINDRQKTKDIRHKTKDIIFDFSQKSVVCILVLLCFLLAGCPPKSDNNLLEDIKIKDLAPKNNDGSPGTNVLKAVSIYFHVLDIPAENFNKLGEIRRTLNIRPLKFNNYLAFSANSFSAYYGRNQTLGTVYDILKIAGAQTVIEKTIILTDGESENIVIQALPNPQLVYFNNLSGDKEAAHVGPGYIALHISAEKVVSLDKAAKVTIFPMFTLMSNNTIPELRLLDKLQDFPFTSAALQLNMTPIDFIFLAPERSPGSLAGQISDQTTLSGIFFNNPNGTMFYNSEENKLPERKPSIRVYLLACVGLNL